MSTLYIGLYIDEYACVCVCIILLLLLVSACMSLCIQLLPLCVEQSHDVALYNNCLMTMASTSIVGFIAALIFVRKFM